jgi:gluconate 2-dehydrogenase gamma chain
MDRRAFITLCTVLLTQNIYGESKNISITPWNIIDDTLQHLFPKSNNFAGSKNLGIDQFIKIVSQDKYFDKSDLEFLIFGAKKLFNRNKDFLLQNKDEKEKALREFEKEYQNWLSLLIYYGFEGMLSDPIYGGNKNLLGYKALEHNAGLPRPKSKYGKSDV